MSVTQSKDPVWDARSRVAVADRYHNVAAATAARRDLHAAKLERRIRETLAASPAITADHRRALAQLLLDGASK